MVFLEDLLGKCVPKRGSRLAPFPRGAPAVLRGSPGAPGDPRGCPGAAPGMPRGIPRASPRHLFMILSDFNEFFKEKNYIGLKRVAVGAIGLLNNEPGSHFRGGADALGPGVAFF